MSIPQRIAAAAVLLAAAVFVLSGPRSAAGDAKGELESAVERGEELWKQSWTTGAKSCKACHSRGAQKMTADRLNAYPRYDKRLKKVATGQEKLNHMIKTNARGKPLPLGHDDLTALEAYIKTLK